MHVGKARTKVGEGEPGDTVAFRSGAGHSGAALALMIGVVVLWLAFGALIVRAAALGPQ